MWQTDSQTDTSSCAVNDMLWDLNKTWISWTNFRKGFKYNVSWKSVQWESSCSTRTDGQTDRHNEVNCRLFAILRTRLQMDKHAVNHNTCVYGYLLRLQTACFGFFGPSSLYLNTKVTRRKDNCGQRSLSSKLGLILYS